MAKQVEYSIGRITGYGKTKTEARENAEQLVALASTEPLYLHYENDLWVVRHSGYSWIAEHVVDSGEFRGDWPPCCTYPSLDDAVRGVRMHQAQVFWGASMGLNPPAGLLDDIRDISEFRSWAEFQLRFLAATERGVDRDTAWAYAVRDPFRTELWAHVDGLVA